MGYWRDVRLDTPDLRRTSASDESGWPHVAALAAVNIWTGSPLLAVWVGSRVVGDSGLSMGAVFLVIAVFGSTAIGLAWALGVDLGALRRVDRASACGAAHVAVAALDARRARAGGAPPRRGLPVERVVITSVVAAVLAFEFWFFLFADGGIPSGTGS